MAGPPGFLRRSLMWIEAHPRLDAVVIGLSGAATFLVSSILSTIQNPSTFNPESFGMGFGAMASGLGLLFKLRQRGRYDDENH